MQQPRLQPGSCEKLWAPARHRDLDCRQAQLTDTAPQLELPGKFSGVHKHTASSWSILYVSRIFSLGCFLALAVAAPFRHQLHIGRKPLARLAQHPPLPLTPWAQTRCGHCPSWPPCSAMEPTGTCCRCGARRAPAPKSLLRGSSSAGHVQGHRCRKGARCHSAAKARCPGGNRKKAEKRNISRYSPSIEQSLAEGFPEKQEIPLCFLFLVRFCF